MNAWWTTLTRRNWQVAATLAAFLVFAAVHALVFRPTLARYHRDVQRAIALGMPVEATGAPPAASGRLTSLLADNSLLPAVAEEQGASGALTAGLLDEVTRLAARAGLQVLATEQGTVTQLPASVQVRAHLKLRGRFAELVDLLGAISRSGSLITLDRFTLEGDAGADQDIEVWLTQLVLKRTRTAR